MSTSIPPKANSLPYKRLPFNFVLNHIKLGDALGMGFEYTSEEFVKENLWKENELPKFVKHPVFGDDILPGMYTDDSQMSSAIIKLMTHKPVSEWFDDRVVSHFFLLEFQQSPRKGYSKGLYEVMSTSRDWIDFLKKIATFGKSTSNGGCMRSVPIGMLPSLDLVKKFARFQAEITHKDTAVDAAELVAVAAHMLMYRPKQIIVDGLYSLVQTNTSYFPDIVPTLSRVSGKEHLGLKTAITAIKLFEDCKLNRNLSIHECIRESILLGGDTDTVAAIVAGFYGCLNLTHKKITRKTEYTEMVRPFINQIR